MSKGGGSTQTVVQPSPLQEVQSKGASQIAPLLLQYVLGGLSGTPSGTQLQGANLIQDTLRQRAGQLGIQPGDPRLIDMFRQITEGLTKPNPDVLQTAISLYTGAPTPGGSQTTTSQPGLLSTLGGIGNLALSASLIAKLLGGGISTAATGGGSTALAESAFLA